METILMVLAGFGAGSVILSLVSFWLIHGILARQNVREGLHHERMAKQAKLNQWETDKLNEAMAVQTAFHQRERGELTKTMATQVILHQTERRELYQRIQGSPVYIEPLLTGGEESGTDKGVAEAKDPDEMSPEDLARIGVAQNSDGGFIDLRSKDKSLFETAKDLLFFREEAEKEKKGLTADV